MARGPRKKLCQQQTATGRATCKLSALPGRDYCKKHGGTAPVGPRGKMPRFYSVHLGPTLTAVMSKMMAESKQWQMQLWEELSLVRVGAVQAIKLFEASLEPKVDGETKAIAAQLMRDRLCDVKDFVLAINKIEKDQDEKVSLQVVELFIMQVVKAVFSVCGDKHLSLARKIEAAIDDMVRMPKSADLNLHAVVGTHLLPSEAAKAMDATIGGE